MASTDVRAKLKARFPVEKVKQREGPGRKKLDYVAGETVISRLIEATADEDTGYAWLAQIQTLEKQGETYLAVVQGTLQIQGDAGTGVGAMRNPDPDMAVKSANTEALKNAAKNGFGVGLELWDAEYRATLGQKRRAIDGNEQAMKALVFEIAEEKMGRKPKTAAEVAKVFDVSAGDLSEPATLRAILVDQGLLES